MRISVGRSSVSWAEDVKRRQSGEINGVVREELQGAAGRRHRADERCGSRPIIRSTSPSPRMRSASRFFTGGALTTRPTLKCR